MKTIIQTMIGTIMGIIIYTAGINLIKPVLFPQQLLKEKNTPQIVIKLDKNLIQSKEDK